MDHLNHTGLPTNATVENVGLSGNVVASTILFALAIMPIFIGSLRSGHHKNEGRVEVLSSYDAAIFPVFASGALLSIFILFKLLPPEYINIIVNLHFTFIGVGAMARLFAPVFSPCFPSRLKNYLYKFEFSKSEESIAESSGPSWKLLNNSCFELTSKHIPGFVVATLIGIWYLTTRHWIANNIIAITLSILGIEYIRLNKFMNGCIILGGLFVYDIFWVFGTPVMVTVAKSLDAPIKVTFPRDFLLHGVFGKQQALLGLGDIVVPGIFVAMLLRFDRSLNRGGSKVYFYTGYAAYIIGLLTTFMVMHTFNAAQPALLYLAPTCLGFPLALALLRGDIKTMFAYEDFPEPKLDGASVDSLQVTEKKKGE